MESSWVIKLFYGTAIINIIITNQYVVKIKEEEVVIVW